MVYGFDGWFLSRGAAQMRKDIHQFSLFYFPRRLEGILAGKEIR
jgi:hypothetical protein